VSRYQKGKTNVDSTEARDSEWQWHQLGHMQVCTSVQTDNHASNPPLSFLQARCPSCRPTNSVKALKSFLCNCLLINYIGQYIKCEIGLPKLVRATTNSGGVFRFLSHHDFINMMTEKNEIRRHYLL